MAKTAEEWLNQIVKGKGEQVVELPFEEQLKRLWFTDEGVKLALKILEKIERDPHLKVELIGKRRAGTYAALAYIVAKFYETPYLTQYDVALRYGITPETVRERIKLFTELLRRMVEE